MSTPTPTSRHGPPPIPPIGGPATDAVSVFEGSPFSRQLTVIPGMLSTLDTLSAAGQHHVMGKVVSFLKDQVGRAGRGLSIRNQRSFEELLGHLTRESERLSPDIRTFSRHAEALMSLLAAIA